jgi:glycosyltransferase involved in cell wall biosynthesis
MSKKTVLFYSSVKFLEDFNTQGFYREDIMILKRIGYNVVCTNKLNDFLHLDYDMAFLYFYKKSTLAAIIANLIRGKKVYFTGGIDDLSEELKASFLRKLIFRFLFLFCYIFSTKINIVSDTDFKNAVNQINYFKLKSNKISLFPHSYKFSRSQYNQVFKSDNFVTVCWMSTIGNVQRKGLDKALDFFSYVYDSMPDSKFYIIGTIGEGTDYLKSLDVYEKVKDRVIFTGFINENKKNNILNNSRYYLQFSDYEGFGIAALEANQFKCFVFHSGSGGFLNSTDIFGSKINFDNGLNKSFIEDLFNNFNYLENLSNFNLRYESFLKKFSSEQRMQNLKKLLNE